MKKGMGIGIGIVLCPTLAYLTVQIVQVLAYIGAMFTGNPTLFMIYEALAGR